MPVPSVILYALKFFRTEFVMRKKAKKLDLETKIKLWAAAVATVNTIWQIVLHLFKR